METLNRGRDCRELACFFLINQIWTLAKVETQFTRMPYLLGYISISVINIVI